MSKKCPSCGRDVSSEEYFCNKSPGINISPPPGWVERPEKEGKEPEEQAQQEDSKELETIEVYVREGNGSDLIGVRYREADPEGELPETGEVEEIEQYIEEMGQSLGPDEMKYLDDMEPVMLDCGLAALYQATDGPEWNYEVLTVRKEDRVFVILFLTKDTQYLIPSPEMQHFISTISFD